jgi:hypothetical protein
MTRDHTISCFAINRSQRLVGNMLNNSVDNMIWTALYDKNNNNYRKSVCVIRTFFPRVGTQMKLVQVKHYTTA